MICEILMGTLNEVVDAYISGALEVARDGAGLNEFYRQWQKRVGDKLGFDEKTFLYLHHGFHWLLFCDGNIDYIQGRGDGDSNRLGLKKELSFDELKASFLKKYKGHLEARLANILSQQA